MSVEQGERGEKGDQGQHGQTGDIGATGDTGRVGLTGHDGHVGLKGEPGERGERGIRGAPAPDLGIHADRLAAELDGVNRNMRAAERRRLIGQSVLMVLALMLATAAFAMFSDLRDARMQRQQLIVLVGTNNSLLKTMQSATTPNGCISARNEAYRSGAVRRIQNDNRALHHAPDLPADPVITKLIETRCPGESK